MLKTCYWCSDTGLIPAVVNKRGKEVEISLGCKCHFGIDWGVHDSWKTPMQKYFTIFKKSQFNPSDTELYYPAHFTIQRSKGIKPNYIPKGS